MPEIETASRTTRKIGLGVMGFRKSATLPPSSKMGKWFFLCPDSMVKVLEIVSGATPGKNEGMQGVCPECRNVLTHEEGCLVCHECGFSKCS